MPVFLLRSTAPICLCFIPKMNCWWICSLSSWRGTSCHNETRCAAVIIGLLIKLFLLKSLALFLSEVGTPVIRWKYKLTSFLLPFFLQLPAFSPFRTRVSLKLSNSGYLLPWWKLRQFKAVPLMSLVKLWNCSCLFVISECWSHLVHSSLLQHSRNLVWATFYSGQCEICKESEVFLALWGGSSLKSLHCAFGDRFWLSGGHRSS